VVTEGVDVVETNAATSGAINISLPSVEGPARAVAHQVRAAALVVARLAKAAATRAVCHLEVPVAGLAVARLVKEAVAVCHLLEVRVAVARQAKAAALAVARLVEEAAPVAVVDLETVVEKEAVAVVDLETVVEKEEALAAARRVIPRKIMTRVIRNQ
jgi:hypothetical protein